MAKNAIKNEIEPKWFGIGFILLSLIWFFFLSKLILLSIKPSELNFEVQSHYNSYDVDKKDFLGSENQLVKFYIKGISDSAGYNNIESYYGYEFFNEGRPRAPKHYKTVKANGQVFTGDSSSENMFYQLPSGVKSFKYFHFPMDQALTVHFKREVVELEQDLVQYQGEYVKEISSKEEGGPKYEYLGLLNLWFEKETGLLVNYDERINVWGLNAKTQVKETLLGQFYNKISEEDYQNHIEEILILSKFSVFIRVIFPMLLMFSGIFLILLGWLKKERVSIYHYVLPLTIIFAGLFIGGLSYFFISKSGDFFEKRSFNKYVKTVQKNLQKNIDANIAITENLKIQYLSQKLVEPDEFELISEFLIDGAKSTLSLEWVPLISNSELDSLERFMTKYDDSFYVKEKQINGTWGRAKDRDEYFPVMYVHPFEQNQNAWGYNLSSNEKRKKTIEKARRSRKIVTSEILNLVQLGERASGVFILNPIYKEDEFKGFIRGVFQIEAMIDDAFNSLATNQSFNFEINDDRSGSSKLLWSNRTNDHEDKYRTAMLLIGDRVWTINFYNDDNSTTLISSLAYIMFFTSLFCSILIAFFMYKAFDNSAQEKEKALELSESYKLNLEEKNNDLNGFIFMVSNELKVPILQNIKMVDSLILKLKGYIDFSVIDNLKDLYGNLERRVELIDGLLNYALLGDKKEVEWVSMQTEFQKLLSDSKSVIDKRSIVVTQDELPSLRASSFEIHLLLKNMFYWFVKSTPDSKSPRIHISVMEEIESWKIGFESISVNIKEEDLTPFNLQLSNSPEHLIYYSDIVQMQKILRSINGSFQTEIMDRQGGIIWMNIKKAESPLGSIM